MVIAIDARPMLTTPRTGVGEYTYELLSHLFALEKTHTYILFTNKFEHTQSLPFQQYPNVSWVSTRIPNKLFHLCLLLFRRPRLDRFVARHAQVDKIDVWFSPNILFTALSRNVRHVLTVHDLSFYHYPALLSRKGRWWHSAVKPLAQVQRADVVLAPSEYTKRDIETVYGVSNVVTLYPGLCSHIESSDRESTATVRDRYDLPEHFLLYLGTLEPRKNIEGILEAYCSSAYLQAHTQLIFAGSLGYNGEWYKDKIAQTTGARYIGYVQESEKYALYTLADTFVYPSVYEGFGLPVLEARASGTHVITSQRSSLPEVVGESAQLVSPYNISALMYAMEDGVRRPTLPRRENDMIPFSWQRSAEQLLSILVPHRT